MAGRAIGGDKVAHAATRNMACCAVVGQGVGVAAALSVRGDCEIGAVDPVRLREAIEAQGVRAL